LLSLLYSFTGNKNMLFASEQMVQVRLITVVFRIGGESLMVAQNTYAVSWFHGRELNMVFGLQLSFSRVVHSLFVFLCSVEKIKLLSFDFQV